MRDDFLARSSPELEVLLQGLTAAEIDEAVQGLPPAVVALLLARGEGHADLPASPLAQARQIDSQYVERPHIRYLSDRLVQAVADVENGYSRRLLVSMPPRSGKSTLISLYLVVWLLRKHPDWAYILTSHDGGLATSWGRAIQQRLLESPHLGVSLARNPSAASEWSTTAGGTVISRGIRGSITGRGARVFIIDDPVKDFVDAHSALTREAAWNWWLSTASTRLEPPSLVLTVMTRWHEDDFAGRILSKDHEGDPADWEVVRLPALADSTDDVLGRDLGQPLYSPLIDETEDQAVRRWEDTKRSVGSYAFASMFQQRPAPAKGAIFDAESWRYWSTNPARATDDGRIVHVDPAVDLRGARWVDSWDCAFKGADDSDFVVGQRWAGLGPRRFLIAQKRGRWSFTETLDQMSDWLDAEHPIINPYGRYVHERLIEDTANGTAIIDVLKERVPGIRPLTKSRSKEAYARAVTPEVEEGLVYLPHPDDPGNEWVIDLLDEVRNFPHAKHDDQVDALTQALLELRARGRGMATVPGASRRVERNVTRAATTERRRTSQGVPSIRRR